MCIRKCVRLLDKDGFVYLIGCDEHCIIDTHTHTHHALMLERIQMNNKRKDTHKRSAEHYLAVMLLVMLAVGLVVVPLPYIGMC